MSAAYGTITNSGSTADALVSASTTAAKESQLHNTVGTDNGSAGTMVQVESIDVPAGGSAVLQPGGYHVMLIGLTGDLVEGQTVPITLTFRSGAVIQANFPVISRENRPGQ